MTSVTSETSKGGTQTHCQKKDGRLLVTIRRDTLDEIEIREPGTVKGNLMMVKRLGKMAGDELGLETWLPPMGPSPIVDELGVGLACTTLIFSLRKGRHTEHLQWDPINKAPTVQTNLYKSG